jgi:hypothetical protein
VAAAEGVHTVGEAAFDMQSKGESVKGSDLIRLEISVFGRSTPLNFGEPQIELIKGFFNSCS